jgi:hypothetical protein
MQDAGCPMIVGHGSRLQVSGSLRPATLNPQKKEQATAEAGFGTTRILEWELWYSLPILVNPIFALALEKINRGQESGIRNQESGISKRCTNWE